MNIPLHFLYPLRLGAVRLPRGSLVRSLCVALLKALKKERTIYSELNEVRPLDAPDISFESVNSMVLDDIFWFGLQGYEGRLADVWATLCCQSKGILEIGGNIGVFTVIGGQVATARYTVLEPVPVNAAILSRNLLRNNITTVDVVEAAAVPDSEVAIVHLNIPAEGRDAPVGAHLTIGVEINRRSSDSVVAVQGLPFKKLLQGCDLVKIDAEGIESELLNSAIVEIITSTPTLVIEVLPEAKHLGKLLANLAKKADYKIYVVPAYKSNVIVEIDPSEFSSSTPQKYHSKDVCLSKLVIK